RLSPGIRMVPSRRTCHDLAASRPRRGRGAAWAPVLLRGYAPRRRRRPHRHVRRPLGPAPSRCGPRRNGPFSERAIHGLGGRSAQSRDPRAGPEVERPGVERRLWIPWGRRLLRVPPQTRDGRTAVLARHGPAARSAGEGAVRPECRQGASRGPCGPFRIVGHRDPSGTSGGNGPNRRRCRAVRHGALWPLVVRGPVVAGSGPAKTRGAGRRGHRVGLSRGASSAFDHPPTGRVVGPRGPPLGLAERRHAMDLGRRLPCGRCVPRRLACDSIAKRYDREPDPLRPQTFEERRSPVGLRIGPERIEGTNWTDAVLRTYGRMGSVLQRSSGSASVDIEPQTLAWLLERDPSAYRAIMSAYDQG